MKRKIAAFVLALSLSVQMTGSVQAQDLENRSSYMLGDVAEILEEMDEVTGENIIFCASALNDLETVKDEAGQRTEKARARDDWNLAAVRRDVCAGDKKESGETVKIAVLDSGVNYRESLPVYGHVTELKGMECNPFFEDATGHGTAVASLIASSPDEESIQGINENAAVYSVQVLDENNNGTLSSVVQGIYWAIENDMDIINMSFGTPHPSAILEKAVKDAKEAGILLIAAAGNDPDGAVEYPAAYEGVCAVGASSPEGKIAADSVRGEDVDIYAPGESVMVNAPLFGTQMTDGSSLACAQVSGAASLIWEKDRAKDAQFIRALLEGTANSDIDPEYGRGLLDIEQALEEFDRFVPEEQETAGEKRIQEKPLPEFDGEEIRALWNGQDHRNMIPSGVGGYKTMYAAAAFPDDKQIDKNGNPTNKLNIDRRFHGTSYYLVTMKFLVNLAHEYYLKDEGDPKKVYEWANNDSRIIKENNRYGTNLVDNIKWFLNQRIRPDLTAAQENTRHNKAYKIMGVAIHLAGDIYAHRTRVTPEMIKNAKETGSSSEGYFIKSDFKNWSEFERDVKDENVNVEFRNIAGAAREKGSYLKVKSGGGRLYEDNINIQSWRYSDAKKIVGDLIGNGARYDFRTHTWNVSVMRNLSKLCGRKDT